MGAEDKTDAKGSPDPAPPGKDLTTEELFDDGRLIDEALRKAAREAYIRHKQAGVPIVIWRDGRTVEIPPEEIEIPPEEISDGPGVPRPQ